TYLERSGGRENLLAVAIENNDVKLAARLLDEGVKPAANDARYAIAAARMSDEALRLDAFRMLVGAGATLRSPPGTWSVLHYGHVDKKLVAFLLENGADVNAVADGGRTPLHVYARHGAVD